MEGDAGSTLAGRVTGRKGLRAPHTARAAAASIRKAACGTIAKGQAQTLVRPRYGSDCHSPIVLPAAASASASASAVSMVAPSVARGRNRLSTLIPLRSASSAPAAAR